MNEQRDTIIFSYALSHNAHFSVIKLFGIVRSHEEFVEQHLVMNGASDVLGQVLGKDVGGAHARSAIGTNTLPLGSEYLVMKCAWLWFV
jgi:hypothetical protein